MKRGQRSALSSLKMIVSLKPIVCYSSGDEYSCVPQFINKRLVGAILSFMYFGVKLVFTPDFTTCLTPNVLLEVGWDHEQITFSLQISQ